MHASDLCWSSCGERQSGQDRGREKGEKGGEREARSVSQREGIEGKEEESART